MIEQPINLLPLLEPAREEVALDATDRRILHALHEDSRISMRALATEVGMSAPAVTERVARLEREHVIHRHSIEMDWSALGYPLLVVLPIKLSSPSNAPSVIAELQQIPALTEILVMASTYDIMARFRVRDHADLQRLLIERVWTISGIERTEMMLSIGRVVDPTPLRHIIPVEDAPSPRRKRS
ncbi:Lrp/AsnC family transcriptional regulator [Microbacterium keratanolyticum]